ncbi:phthiocerol/phenolphthiocerol synthesis type-I polyketide synthase E [Kitasatospora sp. MAP12-15]|uniref:type I polyketide synthase n=1 Tax=unclassified Kitasatospora TaxID=2633591 RepID=UPI00247507ED|nr:beta-ketoacyl synthase N-terminal-like domain-containing protein [Kitasatospora sp. MAP12-44]MDH6112898.1 phthiocerol/phenolphthiocerol synthesis type-I polyketide synthase E [Kitasatospora sp. MAP12-44]
MSATKPADERSIAVVGMACRYPGAADVREFWELLRGGVEGITRFEIEDLLAKGADPELVRRADFVPAKGVLAGSRNFDWPFFRYNRADAANIDPQQRVFLECASTAIDDAGIDPGRFPGRIGVYAGSDRTLLDSADDLSPLVRVISHEKDFVATRVAYKLGLRGPALTVQTACSTSLTAIHIATQALLGGECDVALAGGVAVSPPGEWGYLHQQASVLSPDGHCRPFDAKAAGTIPSEGVGVVVLKRLADALRDGDRIAAVVRGSALNNDGSDKLGFTAPSITGQSEVIRHAHKVAGVMPSEIDYIECHGTATPMGDPVEVAALTDAFEAVPEEATTWLGAVKSNIGHTSAAAGVAGFIKTVLMLEHRELVPTLHFTSPNPLLDLDTSPFRVCTETGPWPERGTPTAAVSAFGVGGTNAHVILQAAPERERPAAEPGPRVLTLSAASPQALGRLSQELAERLEADETLELAEVARTLAGRRTYPHRQTFVAQDRAQAAELLRAAPQPAPRAPLSQVAFLLPGHGVLRHAAGAPAYRLLPEFRTAFDEINEFVRAGYAVDLSPIVTGADVPREWFDDWAHHQVGVFALGYALGRQLTEWGLKPAALFGNSLGEYAAAALAGVWSPTDAASLVYERAEKLRTTEPGRVVAVNAPLEEVARRVPLGGPIAVAMISRGGVVLSGPLREMTQLLEGDALKGLDQRLLNVERAAHCELLSPVADRLAELIPTLHTQLPTQRLISNVTGDWADPAAVCGPDYWATQICRTVQLDEGMKTLLASDCDTFIELGPGSTMLGALRFHPDWDPSHATVPMLGRAEDGESGLLRALGTLWEHGLDILPPQAPAGSGQRPLICSLPGHPFAVQDPQSEQPIAAEPPRAAEAGRRSPLRILLEQLWCRALGVPSASVADNFFALGGESLTVLNLMAQLRERSGVAVSAAEFLREATFGHLLELAERQQGSGTPLPPEGAVVLREGTGRPLFLVADSAASSLGYRALAASLDTARPVLGLEPQGANASRRSIEDIAADHVEALLRAQPGGPYTIGGWSFGAVVAHEMAVQLDARGERVDLLVCLDAYVPGRAHRPIGSDPGFVLGHLRLMASAALGLGQPGAQARRNPALRRLLLDKFQVLSRYRPRPVGCPTVVLKVEVDGREARLLGRSLRGLYTGGLTVRPVSGDHWSMLQDPHVGGLAAQLLEALPQDAHSAEGTGHDSR